jgi:2-oxoglutarate ferredoxin oxidoreductase subunit beta
VYAEKVSKELQADPSRFLLLEHEKGIPVDPSVQRQFPQRTEHDPSDLTRAFQLATDQSKIPVGLIYHNPVAPCYEDLSSQGSEMTPQERLERFEAVLDRSTI